MGKAQLLAPTLAAAFPILFLYAHNISQVTASLVVPVLLVAVGVATVLTLILWRAFRNGAQASLVATVWVLLFFLYGHFYDAMNGIAIWGIVLGKHQILLPLALIVAALALLPALLRQTPELGFMSYITVVLALLVILNLASIATTETRRLGQASTGPDPTEGIGSGGSDSSQLPDIYYIVPDRYPSSSTLEEYFGYDNSEFIEFLEDSGFYIADESFANYHQTFLSLASSLNMEYLDGLSREVGENTSDKTTAYAMLEDNRVWRILKEEYGYSFIHFGSWWPPTGNNPHADVRINKYPRLFGLVEMDNHFFKLLLQTSLLTPFQDSILRQDYFQQDESEVERCRGLKAKTQHPPNNEVEGQCHRTLHTFEQLKEMPSVEGPKFVFLHLLIPHPPFVFGPEGEVVEPPPFYYWDPLSDDEIEILKRSKLDQLAFTNRKLKETIDHILAKAQRPPVIILQADEGPWTAEYIQESPENWTTETLRIRHRILNAYYLPDEAEAHLYPSISPVNTFRVIFNEYLRADLPLLEDKAYMSKSPDRPYSFIEVTGQVKYGVIDAEE